ncbi:MAG: sugar ABC transporter ATP-binding protein [Trueperaceae bacterium]|nr:sugar ABC transporter ATP-binding protein [Trueperaceae bacterium]
MDDASPSPILACRTLRKSFGPIEVLHGVDLTLAPGEVHAIVGENGAGKSTLMKCLSGYETADSGEILLDGRPVTFPDSGAAEAAGVVLIHQEFALVEDLGAAENIFLGREYVRNGLLDRRRMEREARELLEQLETHVDLRQRVRYLSVSQMQMVEIAKAVARNARVLFMDEPTDVLTGAETEVLFALIRRLKAQGVAIAYVSHKLDEIGRIADRVTVLRDGHLVATQDVSEVDPPSMARMMVGRELSDMYPDKAPDPGADVVLRVRGLDVPGAVRNASFDVRRGEVLGFAGLVGAGRTEAFEGLLGLRPATGTVELDGEPIQIRHPEDAKRAGLVYLTEDRKVKGLIQAMRLAPNLTLQALERFANPFLDRPAEREALAQAAERYDIRGGRLDALAGELSGGNQQKLVLAKILLGEPRIVILDEPTRGIDVGTKRQIYHLVHELAQAGLAVVVISSEMQEIIGLSHRVVVMRSGRITGILDGDEMTENEIVQYATGLKDQGDRHEYAA